MVAAAMLNASGESERAIMNQTGADLTRVNRRPNRLRLGCSSLLQRPARNALSARLDSSAQAILPGHPAALPATGIELPASGSQTDPGYP
jgi:hypothetical protein